jgi:hypothetical protein
MRQMRWSWPELRACPIYVRRYVWDFLEIRAQAERDAAEDQRRRNSHG